VELVQQIIARRRGAFYLFRISVPPWPLGSRSVARREPRNRRRRGGRSGTCGQDRARQPLRRGRVAPPIFQSARRNSAASGEAVPARSRSSRY
jgi:hypothetical protein